MIEPEAGALDVGDDEALRRIGLGTDDVLATADKLGKQGMAFVEQRVHTEDCGALTKNGLGGVNFELVHTPAVGRRD